MKRSEEILNEIKKTQEQLESLQKALVEAEKNETRVPDNLRFQNGEICYSMAITGATINGEYYDENYTDRISLLTRRLFKTREYARMFAEKTQFIADCLHFKYLYDRDYKPDFEHLSVKYTIYYDGNDRKYKVCYAMTSEYCPIVYFSTKEIAEKCADWFNERMEDCNDVCSN